MKKSKLLVLTLIIVVGFMLIIMPYFGFPVLSLTYWWILFFALFLLWNFHLSSRFTLWGSFILFILSALTTSLSLNMIGELIMRLSFLSLIIGFMQALAEYKKTSEKNIKSD